MSGITFESVTNNLTFAVTQPQIGFEPDPSQIVFQQTQQQVDFQQTQPQINSQQTQPQISFTAVPGIATGIEEAPIDGLPYNRLNSGWVEDQKAITESVTKTVAADGDPAGVDDFDSLHDAIMWLQGQFTTGIAQIKLILNDGTHYLKYTETYYTQNVFAIFDSESEDASLCTITIEHDTEPDEFLSILGSSLGSLFFYNITIDGSVGGYLYPDKIFLFTIFNSARAWISYSVLKNIRHGVQISGNATGTIYNTDIDNCSKGVVLTNAGQCGITNGVISNCTTGISVGDQARCFYNGTTFSGNTSNTSSPVNEVRKVGSFIADNTGPLVPIYSSGTTAERPSGTVVAGFNYFDTTLGIPIWYDGTNWVNSVGTTV